MTTIDHNNDSGANAEPTKPTLPSFTTVVDWHASPDPQLQSLADYANSGIGIAVTLFLPWGIVAGQTMSAPDYFEQSAKHFRDVTRGTEEAGAMESFVSLGIDTITDEMKSQVSDDSSLVHDGYGVTAHIQLHQVVALVGGQVVNIPRIRLKLSAVTGWTYGTFPLSS